MGWTSSPNWTSPSTVREETLRDLNRPDVGQVVLAHRSTSYGRHLWVAIQTPKLKFVILYLISGSRTGGDYGYAVKEIDEFMGPVEIDCPVELLDMTTEPTEGYAIEWRKRVREAAEARKGSQSTSFKPGDKCRIYGKTYVVVAKVKRSYIVSPEGQSWRTYKCGPSKMKPYLTPEQVAAADKIIEATM